MSERFLAIMITVATAALYLTGYGYLYGYYQFFDIGIWELNLTIQDILAHSASAMFYFLNDYFIFVALLAFIALLIFALSHTKESNLQRAIQAATCFGSAIILASLIGSTYFGREKAASELRLLNRFVISDSNGVDPAISALISANATFLHLATTADTFFVVGVFESGRDRWIGRISREDQESSFVYQDP